jgi:DNA polymerase/3'-5' exonuclease PolX
MKTKFPRAAAIAVAKELCAALAPLTERLIVAGSLRRRKQEVGDVEIIYIPKTTMQPDGLFDQKEVNLVDTALEIFLREKLLGKRKNSRGSEMWGQKNKLAVHLASGIPVDLFSATPENWFNYLVCRTGGADSNTRIASTAQAKNWQWNPYGPGFTNERGEIVPVLAERDVFDFVGLPYLEPWERA